MKKLKIMATILFFIFISIKCAPFLYGETTYEWDFDDGTHSTEPNPKHTYEKPGRYEWTLTVTIDGVTCQRKGITDIQPNPNSPISYKWDFGDGTQSTVPNPKHIYKTPRRYEWTLTVTIDGVTCQRKGITNIQPDPNSPITYRWDFGDGTPHSFEQNPKHTYTAPGPYKWTLETTADGKTCEHSGVIAISPPNHPDLNDDGKVDILWRNDTTGKNRAWLMDGTVKTESKTLEPLTNLKWKMTGTGDFNGDKKSDILWRNSAKGKNIVWFMDGTVKTGQKGLDSLADPNWQIAETGDFNGDQKTDILWRHNTNGQNLVWFMDGTVKTGQEKLDSLTNRKWKIVGTGDFNGDYKTDILWRHNTKGKNMVWFMDGTVKTGQKGLAPLADPDWQIVGTGDFNGDKKIDILWRNKTNGQNLVWFMDGIVKTGKQRLAKLRDTNWKIFNSGD